MSHPIMIGVLALQGAFSCHINMLKKLGIPSIEVRNAEQLHACDGLIIPGGESTTLVRQIAFMNMHDALCEFGKSYPIFGTCAGMILLSENSTSHDVKTLGLIPMSVQRNAYGRQSESFAAPLIVELPDQEAQTLEAIFIRAPKIHEHSSDVKVLARRGKDPIIVQYKNCLASSIHPELGEQTFIHEYFASLVCTNKAEREENVKTYTSSPALT
ncbi:MAG: pyridoxal 5'-phosphate synthase glutaminase subunit PdxT [Waddliaceae bacterium]|nr:pyridoxal 5'-phosphate synthase glutaminase subunit PdxT [Waddliaceae bacterium]